MFSSDTMIAAATGLIVGLGVAFLMLRLKSAEARGRMESQIDFLTRTIEALKTELDEKTDALLDAQTARARLETSLSSERESLEAQRTALDKMKEDMTLLFKAVGQESLEKTNKAFLELANQNFEKFHVKSTEELDKRRVAIEQVVKPVSESLVKMDEKITQLEKERQGAFEALRQHMTHMVEDQQKLRLETNHLVRALRSPSSKGRWGEMHLKNTVKMAGLLEHVDFIEQDSFSDGDKITKRPDMVVHMPGGQKIIVDAKAPIDAYYDTLSDNLNADERDEALARLARLVRDHIKSLSSKAYWDQFESPEFVVMFLPNEGCFSAAVEKDPSLLEFGIEHKVIAASPTTLVALLRAVAYGWQQEKIADNAREISDLGSELYRRLSVFGDHLQKVGNGLTTAMKSYNHAVGSLEGSVFPSARRFEQLHVTAKQKQLPDLKPVEDTARALSAPEFLGIDDAAEKSRSSKKSSRTS